MANILINDNLCVYPEALPTKVCEDFINHYEKLVAFKECSLNGVINKEYRDSHQVHIKDVEQYKMLWDNLKRFIPETYQGRRLIGPDNRTVYLLRYGVGQQFKAHRDGHSTNKKGQKSFLTALIYLNSNCKGGETRFYAEPQHNINLNVVTGSDQFGQFCDVTPTAGSLVLMRHYIYHSAMPVLEGYKYALRFNILYESFGPWYTGAATKSKYEGVGVYNYINPFALQPYHDYIGEAWQEWSKKNKSAYIFLPQKVNADAGRPPKEGEGYCNNCYEILDLQYDYYVCPGCNAPVIYTNR